MNKHTRGVEDELRAWLAGSSKVVVAGIGNAIRMDDYVGVKIVEDLRDKMPERVHLIECETVPESFVDEIIGIRPTHVLLIDAAVLGHRPGTAHLYDVEEVIGIPTISTHTLPLRVFCDYVEQLTGAKIALILIEPKIADFGEGLTPEVAAAAIEVEIALLNSMC
ncbi:MAG: hydrogenase maturation protease [Euryarchaeota archaeon]|nr:hydrogenase maturation protease [Euryarchaeota archaeon]